MCDRAEKLNIKYIKIGVLNVQRNYSNIMIWRRVEEYLGAHSSRWGPTCLEQNKTMKEELTLPVNHKMKENFIEKLLKFISFSLH